jgi:hypothetical protein
MRTLIVSAIVAAAVGISSTAALADIAMGSIATIDAKAASVTLADGRVYFVPTSVMDTVMVGDFVTITFTKDKSGKLVASDVATDAGYK